MVTCPPEPLRGSCTLKPINGLHILVKSFFPFSSPSVSFLILINLHPSYLFILSPLYDSPSLSLSCPAFYSSSSSSRSSFLSKMHSCCIKQDMLRGRMERREKMDSVWALHYNGELSQGRFGLHLNDASICNLFIRLHVRSLWFYSTLNAWYTVKYL